MGAFVLLFIIGMPLLLGFGAIATWTWEAAATLTLAALHYGARSTVP